MTSEVWSPKREALILVGLLVFAGHVVRLSRLGEEYVVRGGPQGMVRFVPRRSGVA